MKLLHIDSSILGDNSVSRELSRATVERLRKEIPNLEATYRDLVTTPVPHLSGATFSAGLNPDARPDQPVSDDLALGDALLGEFLAADIVVIGIGFYNLSVPSQLKAWIDRIVVIGKTFGYSEHGVVGLAGDKRLILTVARGGLYGPGSPMAPHEHAATYLRSIFGLMGISDMEVIAAEGVAMGPEPRSEAIRAAHTAIGHLQTA